MTGGALGAGSRLAARGLLDGNLGKPVTDIAANFTFGTLSGTVTGLAGGTPYTFTVTAHNSAGDSVASAPSNSVTPSGSSSTYAAAGTVAAVSGTSGAVAIAPPTLTAQYLNPSGTLVSVASMKYLNAGGTLVDLPSWVNI